MKIYYIGDSLTYGFQVPMDKNWIYLASKQAGLSYINYGLCGDSTRHIRQRLLFTLENKQPDGIFIMGGTNDILEYGELSDITANLTAMAEAIQEKQIPFVVGIPPRTTRQSAAAGWQYEERIAETNETIRALREFILAQHWPCIDFYAALDGGEEAEQWYDDGVHPNCSGYAKMAEAAVPVLTQVFSK